MESLDSHVFKVHHRNILFIEVVDDIVECGRKRSAESESFIQLLTRGDVVLIVVIELNVHENLEKLLHFYFVAFAAFQDTITFDSKVKVGKLIVFPVIQIA